MVMILLSQMMKKYKQILLWTEEDDNIMNKKYDTKYIDKKHEYIKINDFLQILSIYRTQ